MNNMYQWHGVNRQGQRVHGNETANNSKELHEKLKNLGISVLETKAKIFFNLKRPQKISVKQISEFTRQLSILLQANVDLANALKMTIQEDNNTPLALLIAAVKKNIENGLSFSESLSQFPHYFDNIYCGLIQAGEQSGTLGEMVKQLADYQEKMLALRAKIIKSLFYPTIVATVAILVTVGLLVFVVPQFKNIFNSFGAQLPLFTQGVIQVSSILQAHLKKIILLASGAFMGCRYLIRRYQRIGAWRDYLLLKLPVIGKLLIMAIFCRWTRILATLLTAGLSLVDALKIAKKTIPNRPIRAAMDEVINHVSAGSRFYQALSMHPCFSRRITQMVAVGENAGQLATILEKIADIQQNILDHHIDYFSKWLEPSIMIVLAVITGSLIIAMYLPVFQLGAAV